MNQSSDGSDDGALQVLWEDGDRVFCRTWREGAEGRRQEFLAVTCAGEQPTPGSIHRLTHEYGLKDHLGAAWALRPRDLLHQRGQAILLLEPARGEPLDRLIGRPMEVGRFLRLAVALSSALGQLHQRGLIHKDIKPTNILVDVATDQIKLTGFGIASPLPRERQAPGPPEVIAGTLAYMAPEQTGRMNRSVDSRSDLYSLGVTLYQMLTGSLPFTASDPTEWVHCHIARTPAPPQMKFGNIPAVISQIIMKLLAKTAEERYQTAAGVERDLRRCRAEWETRGRIDEFTLAEHDVPDRLLIPEKLYGRSREVAALLSSFHHVVATGAPELVLVSGYSGIGKSSVVNELHKVLVPPRALFASGKFDQYKRDVPYATVARAFQSLVRQILSKSEAELQIWRDALREALGPNGLLIVGLIPELELVIGKQPPVPDLPSQDAQRRFQTSLQRFIAVFARPEHPLALFLDDLQWLDAATLDLLEDLLTQSDIRHLLLIGAYRDNELEAAHPLMRKLDAIRRAGVTVRDIVLAPLTHDDLVQLISDSLGCETERANPLVRLVREKTGGNPFFAIQFLAALADEALLVFDQVDARWWWDLDRIHAKRYTDNVVDLMVVKLNRLQAEAQAALRQLACVGSGAEFSLLATACQASEEELHGSLWEAVRSGVVLRSEGAYAFQHDRIQEAAYSLVPEVARAAAHLRIGRLLLAHTPPERREENIFEIVNQLNRSSALITSRGEREQLAQLNRLAGKRAKNAAAYSSALTHFVAGSMLLAEDCWTLQYPLTFELEFHRAECEFLTGELASAEDRLSTLASRAANIVDQAAVTSLRVDLYEMLGRKDRAVAVCLEYLRPVGLEWSPYPKDVEVQQEYERLWEQLGARPIEDLINLPLMKDADRRATIDVLSKLMMSGIDQYHKLYRLTIAHIVNLSLEHGNSNASCHTYMWLGRLLAAYFGDFPKALRFAQLSLALIDKPGLDAVKAPVYLTFGVAISPWVQHVRFGRAFILRARDEANKAGDLRFICYSNTHLINNLIASGEPLHEVEREAVNDLDYARKTGSSYSFAFIINKLSLIWKLKDLPLEFSLPDGTKVDEDDYKRYLEADPNLTNAACSYWTRRLQACVFAEDYVSAVEAAVKARGMLFDPSFVEQAEYHFYAALAQAGSVDTIEAHRSDQQMAQREGLTTHHQQLQIWAARCPENFENYAALAGAELARLEGRDLDAMRLYEQAIRSARTNGFVHNEALACEIAARFYAARGLEDIAKMYLVKARDGYVRWGADGKARQLEARYPQLAKADTRGGRQETTSPDQQLDVASVVKASQALSGEIELPKLIERLMTIAIENAGADRGLLILPKGDEYLIQAEARATGEQIEVINRQEPITRFACPESVVRYVIRTQESVILDDASKPNLFSADDYLRDRQSKSILCLPLIKQQELTGILLLENALTSHAFTPARIGVLELLAAQAAISLENARLYVDLQEREAKVRRLVDSNIIGILIGNLDGHVQEANRAFLDIVEYDQADLAAGRLRRSELTPTQWHDRDAQALAEMSEMGTAQPYEKEYFRKDGTRVPVLVGSATFGEGGQGVVAFVVDLTDRKRAEDAERRYHEIHMELAHANRVATLGQLSASIAHELNQPLSGIITNASTGLRMLSADPPNIEGALETGRRTLRDGNRAHEVIKRLRALFSKKDLTIEPVDLNEATREVIALSSSEFHRVGVIWRAELADDLPLVRCDRVQLQQVILNLLRNAQDAMSAVTDRPKRLMIRTAMSQPDHITLAVQDSGRGVAPANLERIFDAFYSTKPGGMGMGLSVCRAIVEAHGGKLRATTGAPHGAVFELILPVSTDSGSRNPFAVPGSKTP